MNLGGVEAERLDEKSVHTVVQGDLCVRVCMSLWVHVVGLRRTAIGYLCD